jgi:hypothetical protein
VRIAACAFDGSGHRVAVAASASRAVQDMMIFSGNANIELAQQIADRLGKRLGNITVSRFADGASRRGSRSGGVSLLCSTRPLTLWGALQARSTVPCTRTFAARTCTSSSRRARR